MTTGLSVYLANNPAVSATNFSFSRNYDDSYGELDLSGEFSASDFNKDHIISANEVQSFTAQLNSWTSILPDEPKEIDNFHYAMDTNILSFSVSTTGRTETPFEPLDLRWTVDFRNPEDIFQVTDYLMIGFDPLSTGVVIPNNNSQGIPESNYSTSLLILGLGFILSKICRSID